MRIQDRIKKIRKMFGVELRHKISPIDRNGNVFTQTGDTCILVGVVIYSLYDIRLIVHVNGSLYVKSVDDDFLCDHISEIPLVSKHNGAVKFHQIKTHKNNVKVIFINSDDYNQSVTTANEDVVKMMSESLNKLEHNIAVQKKCIMELSNINLFSRVMEMYGFCDDVTNDLMMCGLTDIGWNNSAPVFNSGRISREYMLNYRKLIMQKETLVFNLGMIKTIKNN